jgi:hypothetical protein
MGLDEFSKRMLSSSRKDVTYILESEALTSFALATAGDAITKAIEIQEEIIRDPNIHPRSAQIIRINIAKLYLAIQQEERARSTLKDLRLRQDHLVRLKIENDAALQALINQS